MCIGDIHRQVAKEYKDVIEEDQRKLLQEVKKELRCPMCNDTMTKIGKNYICISCNFELS